jgi:hypothetical protein
MSGRNSHVRLLPDSCISHANVRTQDFQCFSKNMAPTFLGNFLLQVLIFAQPIILQNKLLKNIATFSVIQIAVIFLNVRFLSLEITCLFLP